MGVCYLQHQWRGPTLGLDHTREEERKGGHSTWWLQAAGGHHHLRCKMLCHSHRAIELSKVFIGSKLPIFTKSIQINNVA